MSRFVSAGSGSPPSPCRGDSAVPELCPGWRMLRGWSQLCAGAGGVIGRTGCWWRAIHPSFELRWGRHLQGQGSTAQLVQGIWQALVHDRCGWAEDSRNSLCKLQRTVLGWGLLQTVTPVLCVHVWLPSEMAQEAVSFGFSSVPT